MDADAAAAHVGGGAQLDDGRSGTGPRCVACLGGEHGRPGKIRRRRDRPIEADVHAERADRGLGVRRQHAEGELAREGQGLVEGELEMLVHAGTEAAPDDAAVADRARGRDPAASRPPRSRRGASRCPPALRCRANGSRPLRPASMRRERAPRARRRPRCALADRRGEGRGAAGSRVRRDRSAPARRRTNRRHPAGSSRRRQRCAPSLPADDSRSRHPSDRLRWADRDGRRDAAAALRTPRPRARNRPVPVARASGRAGAPGSTRPPSPTRADRRRA